MGFRAACGALAQRWPDAAGPTFRKENSVMNNKNING